MLPSEALLDTTIGHRFDHQIDVSRTTARKTGDRIHPLFGNLKSQTDRAEQIARGLFVLIRGGFANTEGGSPLADQGGCVGHATDHAHGGAGSGFKRRQRNARCDRNNEHGLVGRELAQRG